MIKLFYVYMPLIAYCFLIEEENKSPLKNTVILTHLYVSLWRNISHTSS